jgi:integrase
VLNSLKARQSSRQSLSIVFPACEAAGIEREHPDRERIDPSRPIKSWRSAWRAALTRAGLQARFHDLRHTCITKLAESQASEQTLMAIAATSA